MVRRYLTSGLLNLHNRLYNAVLNGKTIVIQSGCHCSFSGRLDLEVQPGQYYTAAFVTPQGVPQKYGRDRENRPVHIIDALRKYLAAHHPIHAELRGVFVAV